MPVQTPTVTKEEANELKKNAKSRMLAREDGTESDVRVGCCISDGCVPGSLFKPRHTSVLLQRLSCKLGLLPPAIVPEVLGLASDNTSCAFITKEVADIHGVTSEEAWVGEGELARVPTEDAFGQFVI